MHIGKYIESVFRSQGRTVKWFADKLACQRANVYDIFKRQTIDTDLLQRISVILGYNFFEDLRDEVAEKISSDDHRFPIY